MYKSSLQSGWCGKEWTLRQMSAVSDFYTSVPRSCFFSPINVSYMFQLNLLWVCLIFTFWVGILLIYFRHCQIIRTYLCQWFSDTFRLWNHIKINCQHNSNDVNVLLFLLLYSCYRFTRSLVCHFSKSVLRLAIQCLGGDSDHLRGFVPLQDNTGKWKHP